MAPAAEGRGATEERPGSALWYARDHLLPVVRRDLVLRSDAHSVAGSSGRTSDARAGGALSACSGSIAWAIRSANALRRKHQHALTPGARYAHGGWSASVRHAIKTV